MIVPAEGADLGHWFFFLERNDNHNDNNNKQKQNKQNKQQRWSCLLRVPRTLLLGVSSEKALSWVS